MEGKRPDFAESKLEVGPGKLRIHTCTFTTKATCSVVLFLLRGEGVGVGVGVGGGGEGLCIMLQRKCSTYNDF